VVPPDPFLVIAVDHPSLNGTLGLFLDELRAERGCKGHGPTRGRVPFPELIERLGAPKMMRLGVMQERRLIAVAAVDNQGAVALAVVEEYRRRGIANELVTVLTERAGLLGYPPLHRFTAPPAELAG
jgi:GNAT superfamily N-acetyltransferase